MRPRRPCRGWRRRGGFTHLPEVGDDLAAVFVSLDLPQRAAEIRTLAAEGRNTQRRVALPTGLSVKSRSAGHLQSCRHRTRGQRTAVGAAAGGDRGSHSPPDDSCDRAS